MAFGEEKRSARETVDAFEEVVQIIKGLLHASDASTFSFQGSFYQVEKARFGPTPAHRIPIWTGAYGKRMLKLTGRYADGILVTSTYVQPDGLDRINRHIDLGAKEVSRQNHSIRRGYNLLGFIDLGLPGTAIENPEPGQIIGDQQHWIDEIVRFYQDYRQDTFIFWPIAGDETQQIEVFVSDIVPAVKKQLEK